MSVFSRIKRGRQAAKEHNAKRAQKQKQEAVKPPYRHVPTHAAIDAMASGPASSREDDRVKIVEQNRRRSTLTASGIGMSGMVTPSVMTPGSTTPVPGMPRVHSSLSHASFPHMYAASPVVPISHAYSYVNVNANVNANSVVPPKPSSMSVKGKEVERPMPSNPGRDIQERKVNSPYSSAESGSSQDELEMRHSHQIHSNGTAPPQPVANGQSDYFHRLHPSHSRKTSDIASPNYYPPQPRSSQMALRPVGNVVIPSEGIPPVPSLPPLQLGGVISGSAISSSTVSMASSKTLPVLPVTSSYYPKVVAPSVRKHEAMDDSGVDFAADEAGQDLYIGAAITGPNHSTSTAPLAAKKATRASKSARFADMEAVNSFMSPSEVAISNEPRGTRTHSIVSMAGVQLPSGTFVDRDSLPEPVRQSAKSGKITKTTSGSPKAPKKNRWSLRSSKTPVTAQ